MIDKYLPSGDLFALYDNNLKSVCVVVPWEFESLSPVRAFVFPLPKRRTVDIITILGGRLAL